LIINNIYGGQTERDLNVRLREHMDDNSRFEDIEIIEICKTSDPFLTNDLEAYLINKIGVEFEEICVRY
jgi:hypothetical protein